MPWDLKSFTALLSHFLSYNDNTSIPCSPRPLRKSISYILSHQTEKNLVTECIFKANVLCMHLKIRRHCCPVMVGWELWMARTAVSSVGHPPVTVPLKPSRSAALLEMFIQRLIEDRHHTLFLTRLHAAINLPSYRRILIKTKMIAPRPRTSSEIVRRVGVEKKEQNRQETLRAEWCDVKARKGRIKRTTGICLSRKIPSERHDWQQIHSHGV